MAYSLKFREEIMEYIDGFHTYVEVAEIFHISEKTMGYKCSCDSVVVETWMKEVLIPDLPPDSVVVLDNASFHNRKRTKLLKDAGCSLIFLPPYSPDLNPIKHFWDWMKNKVRYTAHLYETLELAVMAAVNSK